MSSYFRFISISVLLLFFYTVSIQSFAQATLQNYLSANELILKLEQKHNVKIFYKPNWFSAHEFSERLLEQSLNEALLSIANTFSLTILNVDGYFVLIPKSILGEDRSDSEGNYSEIGNPLDFGRYAKAQVQGYIYDGTSGEPLIGAIIFDEVTGIGVSTNNLGFYSFILPAGEHKLKLSYLGYEDTHHIVKVNAPGTLNFDLFEKSLQLESAVITAYRQDANIRSTQMSIVRLDPMMLKELPGALGERDIIKSFTLLPGIQSMGEFGTGFNVRGGDSDQNLILVEDMPLFNSSHLFGLVSVVNPDMVTGVTLFKAGIPARFGERASSVVDIRKRGGNPQRAKLTGGLGLLYSRLHLETPLINRNVFLSIGGRSSYSNWLLNRIPDADLMNSSANFYDLSGVLTVNLGDKNSLSFFGYQSFDSFLLSGETQHAYQSQLASIRYNSTLSPFLTTRVTLGLSNYNNQVEQPIDVQPKNAFSLSSDISYKTLKWHFDYQPGSNWIFDFGLQAIHYGISPGNISPLGDKSYVNTFSLKRESGLETGIYASANIEVSPKLSVDLGLRGVWYGFMGPSSVFEYKSNQPRMPQNIVDTVYYTSHWKAIWSDGGLEPRIGFRYLINDNNSLKISYNRNHQYVNLLSTSAVMSPTDVWRLSNMFTGALLSDQVAVGYFLLLPDHNIEVSIEAYLKSHSNLIEYRDGANILMNSTIESDLVNANGYSFGAEFYLTRKMGKLTGWLSYTYARSYRRTNEEFELFRINNNTYFPSNFDRPHNLVLNSSYKLTRRWRINTTFTYNTGRPVTYPEQIFEYQGHLAISYSERNKYRLPNYHRLDISISYDENLKLNARGKGSWSLSLINAYGRKNVYSVFYKKELPTPESSYRKYGLYKMYIIGRPMPTLTYNFTF
jgi:hypothetical protein